MSEPIKLKNPGESVTFVVASCTKVPVGRYPEWEFVGRDGTVLRMPESALQRQLKRLELTADSIVGRRVKIGRSENQSDPAKPYWDLYVEDGAEGSGTGGAPNGASSGSPTAGTVRQSQVQGTTQAPAAKNGEKITGKYEKAVEFVITHLVPKLKQAGIPVTHEGVSAMAATVFIAANDRA